MNKCCQETYSKTLNEVILFIQMANPSSNEKIIATLIFAMSFADKITKENFYE